MAKQFSKLLIIVRVFRPLRWYRNVFMLLGVVIAIGDLNFHLTQSSVLLIFLAFVALCCITSGNYGINEILDVDSDKYHPVKKNRAIPSGEVSSGLVLFISLCFYLGGMLIAWNFHKPVLMAAIGMLIVSAIFYNIKPFRFKELPYVDFIFEALNNPIRFIVGWYAIAEPHQIAPSSFILAYWFFGIFLMAAKRFGEIRFIKDKDDAERYRKSFKGYNEQKLLISMIVALVMASCMLGALAMKHSVDLILFLPFFAIWVAYFFHLAYESNSIVKDPERIFEKIPFLIYSILLSILFIVLINTKTLMFSFVR